MIETRPERMMDVDVMYKGMAEGWERLLEALTESELAQLEEFLGSVHEMTQTQITHIRYNTGR